MRNRRKGSSGLGALRDKYSIRRRVFPLSALLGQVDHRDWAESQIGVSIVECLRHIYEKEQRFQLRDKRPAFLVTPQRGTALVEALFGAYPGDKSARYIGKAFEDVYGPERLPANPATWLKIFNSGAATPLRTTRYGLEANRSWMHDLVVFVFDPEKSTGLESTPRAKSRSARAAAVVSGFG